MSNLSIADRIKGCLLAGAVGDAIGSSFEGQEPPIRFQLPTSLRVTDDTQLTLATCSSYIRHGSMEPQQVAKSFLELFRARGITGIGSSTLKALIELDAGGHWALAGASGERAAGNGAAMRAAPLAFVLNPDIAPERQTIRDICRITHRHDEACVGGMAIIRCIRHAMQGGAMDDELLALLVDSLHDSNVRDRLAAVYESKCSIDEYASRFRATGWVADSVPLAILAAVRSKNLLSTVEQLVVIGGDTDTIASMFGQIHGAAYGIQPEEIAVFDRIQSADQIRATADAFSSLVISNSRPN